MSAERMTHRASLALAVLLVACEHPPASRAAPSASRAFDEPRPVPLFEFPGSRATIEVEGNAVEFGPDGTQLDASLALRTSGWGRGGALQATGSRELELDSGWLVLRKSGLVERWRPLGGGLEQAWRIEAPPGGSGELELELSVDGSVALGPEGLVLSGVSPGERWTVTGLRAWDADGHALPSRFETTPDGFSVIIDDAGARYPVDIDPLYRYEDAYLDEHTFCFGIDVVGGGDVNADGYSDVAIADDGSSGAQAWVYLGSPAGLEPFVTISGLDMSEAYQAAIAFADVNGDGYDDLIAGADAYEEALVFLGPDLTLTSRLQSDCPSPFGYSVANAGDVNGDGYDDVIVGSPEILGWPDGSGPGCVAVYFGSADGVTGEPDVTLLGDEADLDRQFGGVVAGLGDVNADGYDDFGVSSEYDGRIYVFVGSASPSPSGTSADAWALDYLGYTTSLDAAGDVNADGFADVFGAGRDGGQVFLGSAAGLGAGASVWGPEGAARSGAGAGDVNGDGYDDVIAADQDSYIFLGGATGISARPWATLRCHSADGWLEAGAGDVDGDGLDDVLVSSGDEVCLFLGSTLAGPGETGVDDGPGTSPDLHDSEDAAGWMDGDDSPAGTDSDDTEEPARSGKSGCAGGGCGGGAVSAVGVLVGLSGIRRRRTSTPEQRRKRRSAADS